MSQRPGLPVTLLALLLAALLIGPSLLAVPASLTDRTYLALPEHGLSLQHYARFLADPSWRRSFLLSATTALVAAGLATLLGTLFAVGLWSIARSRLAPLATLLRALVLLPLAVPGVIAAIALFLLWTRLGLYDTVAGVILVQLLVGLPFVVVTTTTALLRFDPTLLRASLSLGAGPWRTLLQVVLPGLRGAVLAGFALALVTGWDEAVIMLFVTGRNTPVLPRRIWDSLRYDIDPVVAVVATIMLALTLLGVLAWLLLARGSPLRARGPTR